MTAIRHFSLPPLGLPEKILATNTWTLPTHYLPCFAVHNHQKLFSYHLRYLPLTLILGQKNTHIQDLGSFFDPTVQSFIWHLRETDLKNINDYIFPGSKKTPEPSMRVNKPLLSLLTDYIKYYIKTSSAVYKLFSFSCFL